MAFNPNLHRRKSIRLQGYDYRQAGAYFITICTKDRAHLLGEIQGGEMVLNAFGERACQEWLNTSILRPTVFLDAFVVMPNHVHGIIVITTSAEEMDVDNSSLQFKSPSNSIGAIIRGYKAAVTREINKLLHQDERIEVWQRNFHEHIIRNEKSYHHIADYIINNPSTGKQTFSTIPEVGAYRIRPTHCMTHSRIRIANRDNNETGN